MQNAKDDITNNEEQKPLEQKKSMKKQKNPKKENKLILRKTRRKVSEPNKKQNGFRDPIYQGFQEQEVNGQEDNFGPWVQRNNKAEQEETKDFKKQDEKECFAKYQRVPATDIVEKNKALAKERTDIFRNRSSCSPIIGIVEPSFPSYSKDKKTKFPLVTEKIKIRKKPGRLDKTIEQNKFSSLEIFANRKSNTINNETIDKSENLSNKKQFAKNKSEQKLPPMKLKPFHQISISYTGKHTGREKISKVVYNYCYQDEHINKRMNPELDRTSQAQIKAEIQKLLKSEISDHAKKTQKLQNLKNTHRQKLMGILVPKGIQN